eukprot:CAMPEP_0114492264 /NCGR_PEP_ID=MMETSP0109-20121206/3459_1 /TAXON_ID=29199 /ORGANISM="Chlorarachnion reptans, Strain CCCM449" /LENGTH=42 /DNA_ID= /DNA_START= /DNA_END= /DNA_ORIENTATION=
MSEAYCRKHYMLDQSCPPAWPRSELEDTNEEFSTFLKKLLSV